MVFYHNGLDSYIFLFKKNQNEIIRADFDKIRFLSFGFMSLNFELFKKKEKTW